MHWKERVTLMSIIFFLLGIVLVLLGVFVVKLQPWESVVTTLGGVMVGAGVVDYVSYGVMSQHLVNGVKSEILRVLHYPISGFYESRKVLDPLRDQLKDSSELWIAWHTGRVASTMTLFSRAQTVRIILTHPESNQIKELVKLTDEDAEGLTKDIRYTTKTLLQQKADVRWFDGPLCNSLIISDPHADRAWLRVELLIPKVKPDRRPSVLIEKSKAPELFQTFCDSYEELWSTSKQPPKS